MLGRPASRQRGQALVEFALIFPLFASMIFIIWMSWLYFQEESTYLNSAQTIAEQVARQGVYSAATTEAITAQLNNTNGVSADSTYLSIIAVLPDNSILQCGTPISHPLTSPPTVPADKGWTSCSNPAAFGVLGSLPVGTRLEVDVWSYQLLEVPFLPLSTWTTPDGHAVSYILKGG
jgi:Flp pilus assembly protein TadG